MFRIIELNQYCIMDSKEKLKNAGLRPTRQRMIVADILLNGKNRHFTAEDLQNDIVKFGEQMSLATVYNCLNKFKKVGIINQVESLGETAVFDTNITHHHHFMNEETGELVYEKTHISSGFYNFQPNDNNNPDNTV